MAMGILEERQFAVIESDGRVKVARLTAKGREAQDACRHLVGEIEASMETRFGAAAVLGLRASLEQWVEKGVAPEEIIAAQYNNNDPSQGVERTRPLSPYPQISAYKGAGNPDDAANFKCVDDQDDYERDVANALQSVAANAAFAVAGAHQPGSH